MKQAHPQTVLIVGAGPVGLCAGLALLEAGFDVSIVDSGQRGAGWASGGMIAPLYETLLDPKASDIFARFALEGAGLWRVLAKTIGIELQLGSVVLARTQSDVAYYSALVPKAEDLGGRIRPVPVPQDARALAAWYLDDEADLDPRPTLHTLRAAFLDKGGKWASASVTHVGTAGLRLADGAHLSADSIILANGFSAHSLSQSVNELAVLQPVKGQMLGLAHRLASTTTVRAGRLYLIPRGNRTIIGATSEPGQSDPSDIEANGAQSLLQDAIGLFPDVSGAHISESWAGIRPDTPDHMPMIGPSSCPGVFLGVGTYRNGWLLAPAIARLLVEALSNGQTAHKQQMLFAPNRFSN